MDDRGDRARYAVHDALRQRGFERSFDAVGAMRYVGQLDPSAMKIPVTIEIEDLDFVAFPEIRIDPAHPIKDRMLPHLAGPGSSICYYGKGSVVLDRYDPGGTVLQCLDRAEGVVRDAIHGRSDGDFAYEFQGYWSDTFVYVDLPANHVGPARMRNTTIGRSGRSVLVISREKSWLLQGVARGDTAGEPVSVVALRGPLTIDPTQPWPPLTLPKLNRWLRRTAPEIVGRLEETLRSGEGLAATVLVRATNGLFCYRAIVPEHLRRPEFLKNRRTKLPDMMERRPGGSPVERFIGVRADADYLFDRNLGRMKTLVDKRVLLIGCGTIGGFLAQQLAQCGAGAGAGYLSLVDSDTLSTGNLGRHLLGIPYLGRNKAEACTEFLLEQLPLLAIEGYAEDIRRQSVPPERYDLVIDATGEEALSLALNERAVRARPAMAPHIFVWLLGNGAVAQCLLTGEHDRACLKCLKPELAGLPRFRAMRPETTVETVANLACGDADYVPFPVSRSVAAAALACDLVIDWANGNPGSRFRSLTLDGRKAFRTADASPTPSKSCPACGDRA